MTEQAIIAQDAIDRFVALLGPKGVITDADDIAPWVSDWRGRYHGAARAILSPATTREVAGCVALAAELGIAL
ncbi:FAD-binding oxidoreductase, partial [Pseudoalteromonas sp. NZS100_1]|nr:FAD-binding oxidoreductase [Pseudoalteromonas sp. NZS100_1]